MDKKRKIEDRRQYTFFPPITQFGMMEKKTDSGNSVFLCVIECSCGYRICVDPVIVRTREAILSEIVKRASTESDEIRKFVGEILRDVFSVSDGDALAISLIHESEKQFPDYEISKKR